MNQIYMPTKVFFGYGSLDSIKEVTKDYYNIMIISSKNGLSKENKIRIFIINSIMDILAINRININ